MCDRFCRRYGDNNCKDEFCNVVPKNKTAISRELLERFSSFSRTTRRKTWKVPHVNLVTIVPMAPVLQQCFCMPMSKFRFFSVYLENLCTQWNHNYLGNRSNDSLHFRGQPGEITGKVLMRIWLRLYDWHGSYNSVFACQFLKFLFFCDYFFYISGIEVP